MTVRFTLVNLVRSSPETVFDLSLDVDLHVRSMAAWRERVVGSPTSPLGPAPEMAVTPEDAARGRS